MMAMPLLRFKQDDGSEYSDWENNVLEKFCVVNPKSDTIGNIFYYIDLGAVDYGRLLSEKIIQKENAPSRAKRLLEKDDVLFQTVRPYQMGHFHYTKTKEEQVVASTGFAQLRMKNGYNGFLYQLLYTKSFNDEVTKRCNEGQYPAINAESLKKVPITIPSSVEEQQKIADFLSDIDNQIENYQQSLDNLESQKKELLRQVFSQELRFKRDDGSNYPDWEEKKQGKVINFINGRAYSQDELLSKGKYLVLRVGNLFTNKSYYYSDLELPDNKYIDDGDLIYAWSGSFGPHIYHGKKCIYHYHIWKCEFDDSKYVKGFLYQMLFYDINKESSHRTGGLWHHMQKAAMEKFDVSIPCFEEQQKIANFFSDFDNRLELERQRLQTMQNLKKGLLQQMFC